MFHLCFLSTHTYIFISIYMSIILKIILVEANVQLLLCYTGGEVRLHKQRLFAHYHAICTTHDPTIKSRDVNLPLCPVVCPWASGSHPLPGTWRHPRWADSQCSDTDCHPGRPPPDSRSGTQRTFAFYMWRHTHLLLYRTIQSHYAILKSSTFFSFPVKF